MSETTNVQSKLDRIIRSTFDSLTGAKIVVDENGIILYASKFHYQYLGYSKPGDMIGRPVESVIPGTRMHIVLQTKVPEYGYIFRFLNKNTGEITPVVCNRVPVFEDGVLLGAMSETIFPHGMETVLALANEVKLLEERQQNTLTQEAQLCLENIIIGQSQVISDLRKMVAQVATFPLPVLITGETGTGKEVFANAIHMLSAASQGRFVKINCAAIPQDLLESELFGYEEGAFSGASRKGKIGKFEFAQNGSILLDEIGDMPMNLQAKLLRAIQEKSFEKVGGLKSIPFNARVICTTNCNIKELVAQKKFRQDLYYRINVIEMYIPPLRERKEDIKPLCEHFINGINRQFGLSIVGVSSSAVEWLQKHEWPGNVRELYHAVERACFYLGAGQLEREHFSLVNLEQTPHGNNLPQTVKEYENEDTIGIGQDMISLEEARVKAEIAQIKLALKHTRGNKSKAAKLLQVDRTILYDKIKKYGIE